MNSNGARASCPRCGSEDTMRAHPGAMRLLHPDGARAARSLACAPEARAPMNLHGARASRPRHVSEGTMPSLPGAMRPLHPDGARAARSALRRRVAGTGNRGAGVTARHYVIMRPVC